LEEGKEPADEAKLAKLEEYARLRKGDRKGRPGKAGMCPVQILASIEDILAQWATQMKN
jgi:hypothetical protein